MLEEMRLASHEKFGQVKLQPFLFRLVMLKPEVVHIQATVLHICGS